LDFRSTGQLARLPGIIPYAGRAEARRIKRPILRPGKGSREGNVIDARKYSSEDIAKIAAKLAVGYTLDEIPNDITKKTPACFEPSIDYVVVKIPKWNFEKFAGADDTLGTQMKSVGEVMAIGRTFKQALAKGMRSLETGKAATAESSTFFARITPIARRQYPDLRRNMYFLSSSCIFCRYFV
jgi:hypothetical protein